MMMMIAMMAMVPEQTLWLTVMLEQLSVLSHSEALIEHFIIQHRYFALIAVEVNKSTNTF